MASTKDTKTINLEKEQIEEIERLNEEHPYLKERGFSWITRHLLKLGLVKLKEEEADSVISTYLRQS